MSIFQSIAQLVKKGVEVGLIDHRDTIYVRNQILGHLHLSNYEQVDPLQSDKSIPDLLEEIIDYATTNGVIEDLLDEKEILSAAIMNCFLDKPTTINNTFYSKYGESPKHATDYFYKLSKNSNYIQMKRINHNIHYKTDTPYGELDITINLSKPEKEPEQIKRERAMKPSIAYPTCLLCAENEGYVGRIGHPARSNHRIIEVPLENEQWFLQYSPYVYYNEHCILLAGEHRDMKINQHTFERLTAFVEKFPHYFAGSNADLPIVGGSILSHDHYQGGRYEFAMTKAKAEFEFDMKKYPDVNAAIVKWPLSVIRLSSKSRRELIEASTHVLDTWKNYSDESVSIRAFTDKTPHNTITPIARIRNSHFELDLVLRNNRTSEEHPLGIFHPHEDVHHIKKENIGLIEVMGLAVLPPRLKKEMDEIRSHLLGKPVEVADYHKDWMNQMKAYYRTSFHDNSVDQIIKNELGKKFTKVLEDSGVFKVNKEGRDAFEAFTNSLNS